MSITVVTRRQIFDYLLQQPGFSWHGRLDEPTFLSRLHALTRLPSDDPRHANALDDIIQHRVRNYDWDDDWIFNDARLQLNTGPDEILLEFLAQMVHPAVQPDPEKVAQVVAALNELLAVDGWKLSPAGAISRQTIYAPTRLNQGTEIVADHAHATAARADSAYMSRQIIRMQGATDLDPDLAIGTAKEFIETICKTILDDRHLAYDKNDKLPALVKKTSKALRLQRDDIDPTIKAAETVQRILSNLAAIAQGTAELRNAYGTGTRTARTQSKWSPATARKTRRRRRHHTGKLPLRDSRGTTSS